MSIIKAELVKQLRDMTSVSMMECKRALEQTNGDIEAAITLLRKLGEATAVKKQSRIAAEGLVAVGINNESNSIAIVEINCETDFVAKNASLAEFGKKIAGLAVNFKISDPAQLEQQQLTADLTVAQAKLILLNQLGENIVIRRVQLCHAEQGQVLGYYVHGIAPPKIVSVACIAGGNESLAKDIAMHVVAANPEYLYASEIPAAKYEEQRQIFLEQSKLDNGDKPEDILQKIVSGRVNNYLKDFVLLTQSFVRDPKVTIEQLLQANKAKIVNVLRVEVGEGIEKRAN